MTILPTIDRIGAFTCDPDDNAVGDGGGGCDGRGDGTTWSQSLCVGLLAFTLTYKFRLALAYEFGFGLFRVWVLYHNHTVVKC